MSSSNPDASAKKSRGYRLGKRALKQEQTRLRRLDVLIADSAQTKRLDAVTYRPKG